MKKIAVAAPVALALSLALAGTALATDEHSGETKITTSVEDGYTLTVPSDTSIAYNATLTKLAGDLTVRGKINTNESVVVTAEPGTLAGITSNGSILYALQKQDGSTFESEVWAAEEVNGGTKEVDLSVAITEDAWKAAPVGQYAGTITFRATLQ